MKPDPIAVIGLGLLGRGIAACFLSHGFHVVAVERSPEQHAAARREIEIMIGELIDLGGFDPKLRAEWPARYQPVSDLAACAPCTLVVESVSEDAQVKDEVFNALEAVVSPATIIASNTSALPISQLQRGRKHPGRFVGMHWAGPAHCTRFMELIRGADTSESTLAATAAIARRLGKDPSICQQDIPAFIVNRIGYAMYREAASLLDAGVADADTIDRSMRNAMGLWATICGPLRWIDISGGPELYARAMKGVLPTLSKSDTVPPVMQKLADSGARGTMNGRGFFNYTPEEARQWEELYRRHVWRVMKMHNEYFPIEKEKHD
jgi:3-hydroxybutyryl-CoA dehydrogenase